MFALGVPAIRTLSGDIAGLCWNRRGNSGPLPDSVGTGETNLPHHQTVSEEVEQLLHTENNPVPSPLTTETRSTAMFHHRWLLEQSQQPCSMSVPCWNKVNSPVPSARTVGTRKTVLFHERALLEQEATPFHKRARAVGTATTALFHQHTL